MKRYTCGFYRAESVLDSTTIARCIDALGGLDMDFAPLSLQLSKKERVQISRGAEFDRRLLPRGFFIEPGIARIPFTAANGVDVTFTESDVPSLFPASLLLEFTDAHFAPSGFRAELILKIFKAVIPLFVPDYAMVIDEDQFSDPGFSERRLSVSRNKVPIAIHWINYYGPVWVERIGRRSLEEVRSFATSLEWCADGGILFAISSNPFDWTNPEHRVLQLNAEHAMNLRQLQRQWSA